MWNRRFLKYTILNSTARCHWEFDVFEASWWKKLYVLTYIDLRLTSLLFFDHSIRGQRRWDVIFLTFSLKSRKTISFKHSSTFSTSINYGLCAFFDVLNTMASQIHGKLLIVLHCNHIKRSISLSICRL